MWPREVQLIFQIGDRVVHPVYGLGTVKTRSEKQFGNALIRQYYEIATNGPTVWVPIDEQGNTVLRGIASKASVAICRVLLLGDPIPFDKQHKIRQLEIIARLKGGLLPAMCEMVRDLRARSWGIPLGATEATLLKKLSTILCDEWAASEGVSPAKASHEIEDLLKEGSLDWIPGAGPRRNGSNHLAGW
jgi:CarD family transcriptional regulator